MLGLLEGGYHELDTVFTTLELHDTLEWTPGGSGFALEIVDEAGSGLAVEAGEGNLVTRALRLLEGELGPLPGRAVLTKRIPAGGGLGGGSSDAAALLRGLGGALGSQRLQALAAQLGADVAFLVRGGTARGTGRGEQLEALPAPPPLPVILAFPPFGCPTGPVYGQWDRERYRVAAGCSERMVAALRSGELAALGNDLEPAACALFPALHATFAGLREAGCEAVLLAGSGSTVLGFPTGDPQEVLARVPGRALLTRLDGRPL